jgi:hypothetical protein
VRGLDRRSAHLQLFVVNPTYELKGLVVLRREERPLSPLTVGATRR